MKVNLKTKVVAFAALFILSNGAIHAQSMSKKYKTIKVETVINAPAEKVWQIMVKDYGEIANFSPYIYSSNYESGSLEGTKGAERKCSFNEKGSRWSHEKIMEIDESRMVMRNVVIDAAKFPLDRDNSQAYYRVKDNGDGTSTASYEFQFRTKPAFMGALAKGSFLKTLGGTLIGLRHYVETGEKVNASTDNYDEIKEKYPEATVIKS